MNINQLKQWCATYSQSALTKNQNNTPLIMGILNITPDSFSDGGRYFQPDSAIEQAHRLIAEGADIIDIGGESSKPGSLPISAEEELARVIPVIKQLRKQTEICISIDTTKAQVMHAAVHAGASIINDITGFCSDESLTMAADLDVPLCLMHMQGEPQTMQNFPQYKHVISEINQFFQKRITACLAAGIKRQNLILDPGFGFGKTNQHNMQLVKHISDFQHHKLPVMLGVSRKTTLGKILDAPVEQRLTGGLAIAVFAALQGLALIRTHDVAETRQAFTLLQAIATADEK